MNNYRVVLVDDDKNMLEVYQENLKEEFKVEVFADPQQALKYLEKNEADAVVLDYHIPGQNAFAIYNELRMKKQQQPVLFLTGDACPKIKVSGLELGADDFLHKPISMMELSAHLKNRIRSHQKNKPSVIKIHNLEVNLASPNVLLNDKTVFFTRKEFMILSMLVSNINSLVNKSDMIEKIWPDVKVEENNLDTHLSNLRKKLKGFEGRIRTVKGFGYILRS